MKRAALWTAVAGAAAALVVTVGAQPPDGLRSLPLRDAGGLTARNVTLEPAEFLGRKAVRLTRTTPGDGLAIVEGTSFQDGTIEADIAVKVTTPPGVRMPGFVGIAFRARPDASAYELFYIRPGNSRAPDQPMRNHTVQYSSAPDFSWYRLRHAWPWAYEAHAIVRPEGWTHVRIDVAGRAARLTLDNAIEPTLIVDGLKGQDLRGSVALWGFQDEEAYFSNLTITPAEPLKIANGSDAAGVWDVTIGTDASMFKGSLELQRNDNALSGTWSGAFGERVPVSGTWRNGYVELAFKGDWGKQMPGEPGPAVVTMAGWFDGPVGKGRARVDGRADGQWSAAAKK